MSEPAILFHAADPQNLKASYSPFDQVDFVLANEGRSLQLGSVRIEGELEVSVNGELYGLTAASNLRVIYWDQHVGAHSLCEQFTTQIGGAMIESISDYPRLVKMIQTATQSQTDMFNSQNVCELKAPSMEIAREILMGEKVATDTGTAADNRFNPDFSFKPLICLNKAFGNLAYRRSGDIRITMNLPRNADVLFGRELGAADGYVLRNLRCTWRSVPDAGPKADQPIPMQRHLALKQNVATTNANLQMRVPAVCDGFHMSFLPQSEVGQLAPNTLALARPPGMSEVSFSFNDATNQYITYRLRNQAEWIDRYLDSFQSMDGTNAATLGNIYSNQVFGLGLSFGGPVNLASQKLAVQMNSEVNSGAPYAAYFFFRSTFEL